MGKNKNKQFDVVIIGGGAAGMMCATMIARKGHEVTLFEKNEKLGKKIYITGKGRCNPLPSYRSLARSSFLMCSLYHIFINISIVL